MHIDEARQACKNGAVAAFISGTLTTIVVAVALRGDSGGNLALWNDPTNLVDIALIFGCGVGMLKYSRTAAVSIFLYFVISKTAIALETGQATGLLITLAFLFYFGKAVHGSFAYKKAMKADNPEFRSAPRWLYWMSIPTLTLFFMAAGYGVLSMTDVVPSTEVVDGSVVSKTDKALMIENGIIYDDENIQYMYSHGIASILEGGSVLSDRAVIMYYTDEDDGFNVYELAFDQIQSVQLLEQGDLWNETVYQVNGYDSDNWITISLSTENDGDDKFITALNRQVSTLASNQLAD
jgi:hypothetical protein